MTDALYGIENLAKKGILSFHLNYGFLLFYYSRNHVCDRIEMNLSWKIYVETPFNLQENVLYTKTKGKNAVLVGYAKMDSLSKFKPQIRTRKRLIIAPHHTIYEDSVNPLPLSNFMRYSEFFLQIFEKYPQIDFIFRPHPLLMVALAKEEHWGAKRVEAYLKRLEKFKNAKYQEGGEYFDSFVNSDGIIHDCASFLCEYLYTDHPCCYMLRNKEQIQKLFLPLGQEALKHYYQAFCEDEIINFIEEIILKENDPKKQERLKFANEKIKINFPNVADKIIQDLKDSLK